MPTAPTSCRSSRVKSRKARARRSIYFGQGGELNAVRWNDWKVNFAVLTGNIATGVRSVPGWPSIVHLRADPYETGRSRFPDVYAMVCRQYVAVRPRAQKLKDFLDSVRRLPVPGGEQPECGGD